MAKQAPGFSTDKLDQALLQLEKAISVKNPSDLERDGGIQRFEYCLELAWKVGKRYLADQGIEALTPKEVFRSLGQIGILNEVDRWLAYLVARNYSSHTYQESVANWVWTEAKDFAQKCRVLLKTLKTK